MIKELNFRHKKLGLIKHTSLHGVWCPWQSCPLKQWLGEQSLGARMVLKLHFLSHHHHAFGKLEVTVLQYLERIQKLLLHFGRRVHGGQPKIESTEISLNSILPDPKSLNVSCKNQHNLFPACYRLKIII